MTGPASSHAHAPRGKSSFKWWEWDRWSSAHKHASASPQRLACRQTDGQHPFGLDECSLESTKVPPPPLSFPTPGKTVPHPPLGDRTTTVRAHLQAQKLQHGEAPNRRTVVQDGLAITVISDAAICISVLRMSNDLRQNRFLLGADEHHICPRGKHGCVVKFHFSESEQNVLP